MIPALLAAILFSVSGVSGSRSSRLLGGTEAHFWRMLLAMGFLAVYGHVWGGGLEGAAFGVFVFSGVIGFGIGDLALFQALPRLGSRLSMMIVLCLSSPIAAVMEWGWLGTTLTLGEMVCGGVILAGVAIALAPRENPHIPPQDWVPGVMFGLVAAFCQAYGAVLSRRAFEIAAVAGDPIDGMTAAYQRVLGGVFVTACCLLVVKRREVARTFVGDRAAFRIEAREKRRRWRTAWPWVVVNGMSGPALGVSCFQWALKTTPTGIVMPIIALTPLLIIPLSWALEGERPSARSLAGGFLAVAGAVALAVVAG